MARSAARHSSGCNMRCSAVITINSRRLAERAFDGIAELANLNGRKKWRPRQFAASRVAAATEPRAIAVA
eukprot:9649033-Alexandrium_andersonii.AAC.1